MLDHRFRPPTGDDVSRLHVLQKALTIFSDLAPHFTVSAVRILVAIAAEPGLAVSEYATRLALSQPTISMSLTKLGVRRMSSLGLLDLEIDPDNYSRRKAFLTPKGRALMAQVLMALKKV